MDLQNIPLSQVTIRTHLHYKTPDALPDQDQCPLQDVDPRRMITQSMAMGDRACCSLLGGFGFMVDGRPWYGYWENNDAARNSPVFVRIDHWDEGLNWLEGIPEMLDGKRRWQFGLMEFEDCYAARDRFGNLTIRLDARDEDPTLNSTPFKTDLIHFASELLREGLAFKEFADQLKADLNRRLQVPALQPEKEKLLRSRIEWIDYCNIGEKVAKLQMALAKAETGGRMALAWENLYEVISIYRPAITAMQVDGKEMIVLNWAKLPASEFIFVETIATFKDELLEWQNPFRKKPLPHRFHSHGHLPDGSIQLQLICEEPIPPQRPEYPIHMYGCYLVVKENKDPNSNELDQKMLADLRGSAWYACIPLDRPWLEAAMAIAFNYKHWNGRHIRESNDLMEQAIFPMAPLAAILPWFEAVIQVLTNRQPFTWADASGHSVTLAWSDQKGHLILTSEGQPPKVVETKHFVECLFPELDLLAKKCSHLVKLDTVDQRFPWLTDYVHSLGLPALRKRLKSALNQHSIAARTVPNNI